jgi:peptide/nickel transport system permease protein
MGVFLLRRLAFGLAAMFVALSGSFFFFTLKYWPRHVLVTGTTNPPALRAYWMWLSGMPSGRSFSQGLLGNHLMSVVGGAFGRTLLLFALTLVIAIVIAVPVGCLAAATRGSALDYLLRIGTYIAWAVPVFVVAILLQEGFGRIPGGWGLGWFPYIGWAGECPNGQGIDPHNFQCPAAGTGLKQVGEVIYHLLLPAFALALGFVGVQARYLRNSIIEALDAPHVTVARGKGLTERAVLTRHALRNGFVAFVPALVSDLGVLFGAALAVDYIFQLGGLGTLFISLLKLNVDGFVPVDTYAIQLALLFAAGVMLTTSVLSEVVLTLLDPRTRVD